MSIRKLIFCTISLCGLVFIFAVLYTLLPWLKEDYHSAKNMRTLESFAKTPSIERYSIFTDHGFSDIYEAKLWSRNGSYIDFSPLHTEMDPNEYLGVTQFGQFRFVCSGKRVSFPVLVEYLLSSEKSLTLTDAFRDLDQAYTALHKAGRIKSISIANENGDVCKTSAGNFIPKVPKANTFFYRN